MNEQRDYILRNLNNGDDLERAEMAFSGFSTTEMTEEFGHSGRTRQQILDEYRDSRAKHNAAVAWLKSMPK